MQSLVLKFCEQKMLSGHIVDILICFSVLRKTETEYDGNRHHDQDKALVNTL